MPARSRRQLFVVISDKYADTFPLQTPAMYRRERQAKKQLLSTLLYLKQVCIFVYLAVVVQVCFHFEARVWLVTNQGDNLKILARISITGSQESSHKTMPRLAQAPVMQAMTQREMSVEKNFEGLGLVGRGGGVGENTPLPLFLSSTFSPWLSHQALIDCVSIIFSIILLHEKFICSLIGSEQWYFSLI